MRFRRKREQALHVVEAEMKTGLAVGLIVAALAAEAGAAKPRSEQ